MLKEAGSNGHFQENCRNSPAAHPQPFIEAHPRPMFMMITIFIHCCSQQQRRRRMMKSITVTLLIASIASCLRLPSSHHVVVDERTPLRIKVSPWLTVKLVHILGVQWVHILK
jgi:hypothetical protein